MKILLRGAYAAMLLAGAPGWALAGAQASKITLMVGGIEKIIYLPATSPCRPKARRFNR